VCPAVDELLGELGLEVTVHLSPGPSGAPERWDAFRRSVARAAELQAETGLLRCVSIDPAFRAGATIAYDPDATLRALQEIAEQMAGGVGVAIENWRINPSLEEFQRLDRELVDAKLGLLLDLGHLHVMTDRPAHAICSFPLPVYEVHVSDNDGRSDDHLPLGRGTLPIEDVASSLRRAAFDGIWTLEFRPAYDMSRCCITNRSACRSIVASRARLERALAGAGGASSAAT
jgi:sugar phosphate isomerase/epimerase